MVVNHHFAEERHVGYRGRTSPVWVARTTMKTSPPETWCSCSRAGARDESGLRVSILLILSYLPTSTTHHRQKAEVRHGKRVELSERLGAGRRSVVYVHTAPASPPKPRKVPCVLSYTIHVAQGSGGWMCPSPLTLSLYNIQR
eukprot:scaffold283676_cov27-Tisochrysis_lutea.AAC.1